jgi:hypothetical protein
VNDVLAQRLKYRHGSFNRGRFATDHDRKRRADRSCLAAAHRRVNHVEAQFLSFPGELSCNYRRYARHIEQEHTRLSTRENTVLTGVYEFHVRRVGKHGDNDFASRGNFFGARGWLCALLAQLIHCRAASVVHHKRITRFQKISRHGFAHDAKPDKADGRICHSFFLSVINCGSR